MLKFRPIAYSTDDLRAYKYSSGTSVLEGRFCKLAASTSQNQMCCTLASGTAVTIAIAATYHATRVVCNHAKGMYFPIFKNDPDIESVAATIVRDDHVLGLHLRQGTEFEIHKSALHKAVVTSWKMARIACLATSGKLVWRGHKHSTGMAVAICTGTYNATWVRFQCI